MLPSVGLAVALGVVAGAFPRYPKATQFCESHIIGAPVAGRPGPSINWTGYHTADSPDTVVAWYRRQVAEGLHRREGEADVWRTPVEQPTEVLSVTTVEDFPLAMSCTTLPPSTARAVIVMSTITRHAPDPPAPSTLVVQSFDAAGITRVVLRAEDAAAATVVVQASTSTIDVAGVPTGGAKGYHSPDPKWRETPAAKWGLDFVSVRRGSTLIVSTKNEMAYIHHHYAFERLTIGVPKGVEVVKEPRTLTGDGAPDLR